MKTLKKKTYHIYEILWEGEERFIKRFTNEESMARWVKLYSEDYSRLKIEIFEKQ